MKLYLAGFMTTGYGIKALYESEPPYVLDSFYYLKQNPNRRQKILDYVNSKKCKDFILDSGAFTFMEQTDNTNFGDYLKEYIEFINRYDFDKFFELDVDSVIGTEKVRILRDRLEQGTSKKCIPVWHKCRGKEAFFKISKNYDYISIGGIVSKEFDRSERHYLHWFIREAHKRNAKIHGLGFTPPKNLHRFNWDSVDSTNWTQGGRFGQLVFFNGSQLIQKEDSGRKIDGRKADIHDAKEWTKFAKYMDNGSTQKPAKQTKTNGE